MDNKQAIQELKSIKESKENYITKVFGGAYKDEICALEIAIKALEIKVSVDDIPEEIKEEILKEYAEDIFEEFMQIDRFEGKITLKDVADILQIESGEE